MFAVHLMRGVSAVLPAVVIASTIVPVTHAQSYPVKPIRWIIPSAPGGAFDLLSRALTPQFSAGLGQSLIVENRPAVSGIAAMEYTAKTTPDGYTILTAGNPQIVFNKFVYKKLPYDPQKDFSPISQIADLPFALWIHTDVPAKTFGELLVFAKSNPRILNYGSAGAGQAFHLAMELLKRKTGLEIVHVPYKGNGPALQDFLAGRVQAMFYPATGQMLAQMNQGKIRALAAATDKRLDALPNVATFTELGIPDVDRDIVGWVGAFAPAGTPPAVVARLNRDLIHAANSPDMHKIYDSMSVVKVTSSSELFAQKIDRETRSWGPLIGQLNIELD